MGVSASISFRVRSIETAGVPARKVDNRALQAQTDAKERQACLSGVAYRVGPYRITPLTPNPPGISSPSNRSSIAGPSSSISSDESHSIVTPMSLAMPPWISASWMDLYESMSLVYFPTTAMRTLPRDGPLEPLDHCLPLRQIRIGCFRGREGWQMWSSRRCSPIADGQLRRSCRRLAPRLRGVRQRCRNRAIFRRMSSPRGHSVRHTRTSGWMPISMSSRTECWVGFRFQLSRRRDIRHEGEVNEKACFFRPTS